MLKAIALLGVRPLWRESSVNWVSNTLEFLVTALLFVIDSWQTIVLCLFGLGCGVRHFYLFEFGCWVLWLLLIPSSSIQLVVLFFFNRLWVLLFKQSSWWWNLKKTSILKPLQWLHSPCAETIVRSLRFCEESYQVLPSSVRTGIRMVVSPSLFQLMNNKCCMVFFPLFFLQSLKPWELIAT